MGGVGVLQITDSLAAGGTERVAVNLANHLPRARFRSFLCTTRNGGALAALLKPDVRWLNLARQHRFDLTALRQLRAFIKVNRIQILHAHSTSLLMAALAAALPPYPRLVWHDHYGNHAQAPRPVWIYRLLARRAHSLITVNQPLAEWARQQLGIPAARINYIPNFAALAAQSAATGAPLPGRPGQRIVCVANLRRQKDHLTLLQALAQVIEQRPDAHLLLAGAIVEPACFAQIQDTIAALGLARHVSVLGEQTDVAGLLRQCDIGVLSSASEGLPLALLEYGQAGLAVVSTQVGQCAEVLDDGRAGLLVPPGQPAALAAALLSLLQAREVRARFGARLSRRVKAHYSVDAVMERICQVYEGVLQDD